MTRGTPTRYAPLTVPQAIQETELPRFRSSISAESSTTPQSGGEQSSTLRWALPIIPAHSSNIVSDAIAEAYVQHSAGQRVDTDVVLSEKLRQAYPDLALTVVPAGTIDLIAYASAGHASITRQEDHKSALGLSHSWRQYIPPAKRINHSPGILVEQLVFGKFTYRWKPAQGRDSHEFLLYIVDGRDGTGAYPRYANHYILSAPGKESAVDELLHASGTWLQELRGEIWVFDQGYWQKSADLWNSIKNASWSDVILEESMKTAIRSDVEGFFQAQETYNKLKVPWKRGLIFYGPPGNGKTISIKAMMHTLYERKDDSIPTLYVRSLKSAYGGEYSISAIFAKARQQAPCFLVFEDLDSLVTDQLRSYFLNEVDGLKSNDGILMVGSTNHLKRLDPGIAKRPSRFDRKYLFPNPNQEQREAYCKFWQKKLADNENVEFPDRLVSAIARITDKFSFAYMQEAFVATLLAIARQSHILEPFGGGGDDDDETDPLDKYILWREIKKQIQALREGLNEEGEHIPKQPQIIICGQ